MKNWRYCLYWFLPVACVVAQLVAATIDYAAWLRYLPSQSLAICTASYIVLPFLCAGILTSWLFALGFRFDKQTQIKLVWNSIKAKLVYLGALIGWIGFVSAIGPMLPPSEDYSAGITSLVCIVMLPLVLALTSEYQGCQTVLPNLSRKTIVKYIAASLALAGVIGIILLLAILLVLFCCFLVWIFIFR